MNTKFPAVLLLAFALPGAALAATTCASSNVNLSFGPYLVIDTAPRDAQANFVVTCSRLNNPPGDVSPGTVTVSVALGPSGNSNSIQNRRLSRSGGAEMLNYNVYLDAGRISVWGNTSGVDTSSQTLNVPNKSSASATFTFYGRLFPQQNVPAGLYGDSLLITVNY